MNYKHIHNGVVYTLTNQCWDFGSKREHIGVCICGIQSLCWQQQNDLVCIWKHFKVVKIVSTTSYYMQNSKAIPVLLIMTSPWVGQSIYNYYIYYNADFDVHFVSKYFLVVVIFNLMICWIMPINWLDFFFSFMHGFTHFAIHAFANIYRLKSILLNREYLHMIRPHSRIMTPHYH